MIEKTTADQILKKYGELDKITYHHMHQRIQRCPYDMISEFLPSEGVLLDYGCGHGHFSAYLKQIDNKMITYGFDPDHKKINIAKKIQLEGVNFSSDSFDHNKKYDAVVLLDVLYLLSEKEQNDLMS